MPKMLALERIMSQPTGEVQPQQVVGTSSVSQEFTKKEMPPRSAKRSAASRGQAFKHFFYCNNEHIADTILYFILFLVS
jgi:hypothetical protein